MDLNNDDSSDLVIFDSNQEGQEDLDGQEGSGTTSFAGLVYNDNQPHFSHLLAFGQRGELGTFLY